jgi:hypothetical protein
LSPAKATRPGFRSSLASSYADSAKSDLPSINLFHPIYHAYTCPVGSRIDVEREWPARLEDEDVEDLIDAFSEPPQFVERHSPVSAQIGDEVLRARNWTELMIKVYRQSLTLYGGIGRFIESTMRQGRSGFVKVPFTSLAVDPDTLHRIVEMDYESGESTYAALMNQISAGAIAPCLTAPFHVLLPLQSDAEIRLLIRISLLFFQRVLKRYQEFLSSQGEDGLAVVAFWSPEGAYHERVRAIVSEEVAAFCKKERMGRSHVVFLLDNDQAERRECDLMMKSWNVIEPPAEPRAGRNGSRRGASQRNGLHPAVEDCSVVFRDRAFSEWVVYANPSVKKLLDRTIAKVDSDLNRQEVHYGWAHFEELESLAFSPKSVSNFKQKLIKLTELGYVPLSPDFYVRGKIRGQLGYAESEPRRVRVHDNSAGGDWETSAVGFARWRGEKPVEGNGAKAVIDPRKFTRQTLQGAVEEEGAQCWKVGWARVRERCAAEVIGVLDECKGGMAEVLGELVGGRNAELRRENVLAFLTDYTYVYWREHFIQHELSEADINIHEIANNRLRAGMKGSLDEVEAAIAGAAAQAIYFAFDSGRTCGSKCENLDQRAMYQNVVMLTLAICDAIHVHVWRKDMRRARKLVDLIKTELLDFESAYERYDLKSLGVSRRCWQQTIASHVEETNENLVARAASRVAAAHLRPLGFTRDFSRKDEQKTINVGHLWRAEIDNLNYKYENPFFCGVKEA